MTGVIGVGVPEHEQRRGQLGHDIVGDHAREVPGPLGSRQALLRCRPEAIAQGVHGVLHTRHTPGDDQVAGFARAWVLQPGRAGRTRADDHAPAASAMHPVSQRIDQQNGPSVRISQSLQVAGVARGVRRQRTPH